ncbi:MAG: potassium transporter TrkG, partial [Spirochaetales bacterium]|nr:potassium transporter TrkG [Spirochaetales bacterium]
MSFDGSLTVNLVISALIFAGGISFAVLTDCFSVLRKRAGGAKAILSINSRVVLIGTGTLLLLGMLLIYRTEHRNILTEMPLGEQYLAAFFQSVTLRTAGFNTLPFERLGAGTLMIMMGIMFVGGASGSTAGGIKVNTLGVVWAYMRSFRRGEDEILLYRHRVAKESVLQAFTVIAFGLLSTFMVSAVLMVTERAEPLALLFETVSAFATVGLSTGITGGLSSTGKIGIILLMFLGRLGPLTLLTASSGREKQSRISYPEASSILIG